MDLVVGASESTVKSLLGKLGSLLAQEYTLIRGVSGDLQYINDELASMQSFLLDLGATGEGRIHGQGHGQRMKDWMKQIRDLTYDIEDCVDDSGHRIRGLPSDMCCYFLVNSVYEVLTWWPRRDIATKISNLKMRAQQIGERRHRYGVDNPKNTNTAGDSSSSTPAGGVGFNAAENQDSSLNLVTLKTPIGVPDMKKLEDWVTNEEKMTRVLSIVGFGGVGKTTIATALYHKFRDQFDHHAVVTVSQSSDIEAILSNILRQVKPHSNEQKQQGSSPKKTLAAAVRGVLDHVVGVSNKTKHSTKLDQLKEDLRSHLAKHSYLVLIDDVWSTTTWGTIRNLFSQSAEDTNTRGRIIVTTRFQAVATACKRQSDDLVHNVTALTDDKPKELFKQAFVESIGNKDPKGKFELEMFQRNSEEALQQPQKSTTSQAEPNVLDEVLKMCGGLPLVIVSMAGHMACSSQKSQKEWFDLCKTLLPETKKDRGNDLTQEEAGRIISHCYNDMPAEIKTCSLYLSIFPKGHRISRNRLTRRWIAEGFVNEKQGLSVEDVAETYFSHLIRRKILQPVQHSSNGTVKTCVVHDMILEHIVSKASEENFITVVGGHWLMHQPSSKVRRLSLQVSDSKRAKDTEKMNLTHVRSLTVFENLNQLPSSSFKFGIVQVLDLEDCKGFKQHHIKEICDMVLLKYLSIRGTDTKLLPKMIKKLENLETLDVRETDIAELPPAVCNLERLVNILGGHKKAQKGLKLPEELIKKKKMTGLRILSGIEINEGSVDLHHLIELRKLAIYKVNLSEADKLKDLSSSIEYLCGYTLHSLVINDISSKFLKLLYEMSSPPKFLVALELSGRIVKIPDWIEEQLVALNKLTLSVTALRSDNLSQLSKLKALFSLTFTLAAGKPNPEILAILAQNKLCSDGEIVVPAGGFQSLKLLRFYAPLLPLLNFSENAMPKLERIELQFNMFEGIFGTENLAELKEVILKLNDKHGEAMAKKIVNEVRNAVKRRTDTKRPRITLDH